jgi:hypothetical protein
MAADANTDSASLKGLVSTLIPALLVALVYVAIFLVLRRSKRRYYAPRTYLGALREQERTPALPSGLFNWVGTFWKIPDTFALQHQSLDAYLFLRFLRMCATITFVGCLITWPILFPLNATGGGGQKELNILSFSNINSDESKGRNRLYAHAFIAWIFFGFVLFFVARESIFYINLRQAFLLSPLYANRLSARTVLFTSVPEPYLNEAKLHKVFGSAVKNIWITGDTTELQEIVDKRDKTAMKLEGAEVKLIKLANKARTKAQGAGASRDEESPIANGQEAESGSIAARWVPHKKRPTHKLGKFGLYGQKVDTINWAREELKTLIPEVDAAQAHYKEGNSKKIGGVFIEFRTQSDAQAAFQTLSHHQALHMSPRYIGVNPDEVVWKALKISWWQKVVRRYAVLGFITVMIVFWAIPVAGVASISNVETLKKLSWLSWLNKIPDIIMGVVAGLLPSVLLAILMSLVPIIMRICAKLAGEPSLARVELFTQNAYFTFQVLQVFLVTTLSSGIIAGIQDIIDKPTSAASLLSSNLPKASNFYVSYFILQGLAISAGVISQVVGFVIFTLLYKFLTSTPRSMYTKWTNLSAISWGSTLPVFTNIAVIALTYSMIAPLVLGFATIGISLFYLAYRYNILFVTDSKIDTKGLIYPRALQHLLTGVYLAEVCMIGLFATATAFGPLIIAIILLIFTVLFHISMNSALDPLLYNLPKTLEAEEESLMSELENGTHNGNEKTPADGIIPAPHQKPSLIAKFLKPHIFSDYATLRRLVPHDLADANNLYTPEVEANAYYPPCISSGTPLLWLPRDPAGVSAQEIAHTSKVIPITDEGATLNDKGKIEWDADGTNGSRPPIWEEKIYY